jgi:hypothetical protein
LLPGSIRNHESDDEFFDTDQRGFIRNQIIRAHRHNATSNAFPVQACRRFHRPSYRHTAASTLP